MKKSRYKIHGFLIGCALSSAVLTPLLAQAQEKSVRGTGFVTVANDADKADPVSSAGDSWEPRAAGPAPTYAIEPLTPERKAWLDEMEARRKKDELALKEVQVQGESDQKKHDIELSITQKKRKIYEYESQQYEFATSIEHMKAEIVELDGRAKELQKNLDATEARAKIHEGDFNVAKKGLEETKKSLSVALDDLHHTRDITSHKINQYMIEMQKTRAEIATTEAEIARADNDKSRAEAEELQVRTEWAGLGVRAQSLRDEKVRIQGELADMKSRLAAAHKDYDFLKSQWQQAEHEKVATEQNAAKEKASINAEMKRLEQETATTYNDKANAEAEKVRLVAETDKLKSDLMYVRQRNEIAKSEGADAEGTVMESRLAFETAKANLTKELASNEAAQLRNDAVAVKLRGIASVVESSGMGDVTKPWVATKECAITRGPASSSEAGGTVHVGERVIAAPAGGGFIKILNSSGRPAYIPMNCGHFAD